MPSHLSDQSHHPVHKGNSIETEFNLSKNQLWVFPRVICDLLCSFHLLSSYLTFPQPSTASLSLLTCLHPFPTVMTVSLAMPAHGIVFDSSVLVSPKCLFFLFHSVFLLPSFLPSYLRYSLLFFYSKQLLSSQVKSGDKSSHLVKRGLILPRYGYVISF